MTDKPQSTEAEIRESIGNLDDYAIAAPLLLIGIYMRSNIKVLPNGQVIHLTDKTVDEDKWQNKVGVVLKKGVRAFVSDEQNDFGDMDANVGDWVMCRTADGMPLDIRGVHCRLVEDTHVKMRVTNPADIY